VTGTVVSPNPGVARQTWICTARLRLRPLCADDLSDLVELYADPEVMRGSSGVAVARDRAASEEWLRQALAIPTIGGWMTYRVEDRATGAFFGRCGLRPEAGSEKTELAYAFAQHAWWRRIATEASIAVVRNGFAAGLGRIVGCALAKNVASLRVLEKVGMRRVSEEPTSVGPLSTMKWTRPITTD